MLTSQLDGDILGYRVVLTNTSWTSTISVRTTESNVTFVLISPGAIYNATVRLAIHLFVFFTVPATIFLFHTFTSLSFPSLLALSCVG
jgi:hypothetical protein